MQNSQSLSIILPVYNEGQNIKEVVEKIIAGIKNYINTFELIIVNDGSTDKSADIIRSLSVQYPVLRLINIQKNKGYGAAIRTGINNAQMQWLLIMDADGQYEINDLNYFWARKSGYDFIIGYRKKRSDSLYRRLLGKLGNLIANLFLKTGAFIKDIDCGFKLFKTKDLKMIPLLASGAIISLEILYKLLQNKPLFIQLPVIHYKRVAGRATGGRLKTIKQNILEFLKLILNKPVYEHPLNSPI